MVRMDTPSEVNEFGPLNRIIRVYDVPTDEADFRLKFEPEQTKENLACAFTSYSMFHSRTKGPSGCGPSCGGTPGLELVSLPLIRFRLSASSTRWL